MSQAIDKFELMTQRYEQHSKETFDGEPKAGLVTNNIEDTEILTHLVQNAYLLDTLDKVKDARAQIQTTQVFVSDVGLMLARDVVSNLSTHFRL